MAFTTTFRGPANQLLPVPQPEASVRWGPRYSRYGEPYVVETIHNFQSYNDEGSYFQSGSRGVTDNPQAIYTTVFQATTVGYTIRNYGLSPDLRAVIPDYIRLQVQTADGTATSFHFALVLSSIDRTDAFLTQTELTRPAAPNTAIAEEGPGGSAAGQITRSPAVGRVFVHNGDISAAKAWDRRIARGVMRSINPVVNDEFVFVFGGPNRATAASLGDTNANRIVIPVPPVIIRSPAAGIPGMLCVQFWAPAGNGALRFIPEFTWWER